MSSTKYPFEDADFPATELELRRYALDPSAHWTMKRMYQLTKPESKAYHSFLNDAYKYADDTQRLIGSSLYQQMQNISPSMLYKCDSGGICTTLSDGTVIPNYSMYLPDESDAKYKEILPVWKNWRALERDLADTHLNKILEQARAKSANEQAERKRQLEQDEQEVLQEMLKQYPESDDDYSDLNPSVIDGVKQPF